MNLKREVVKGLIDLIELPVVWGFENEDGLRQEIIKARAAPDPRDGSVERHICNEAAKSLEHHYAIGYSYEDNAIASTERAEKFFHLLDRIVPGRFVLVTTGDYIFATCGDEGSGYHRAEHWDCETYDPHYWYYLVPRHEWELQAAAIERADAEWREEKRKCSLAQHLAAIGSAS